MATPFDCGAQATAAQTQLRACFKAMAGDLESLAATTGSAATMVSVMIVLSAVATAGFGAVWLIL